MARTAPVPTIAQRTARFFLLRQKEVATGGALANAIADVGDELTSIKADLDRTGRLTEWLGWIRRQGVESRRRGLPVLEERTAQRYMRLGRLRARFRDSNVLRDSWKIFVRLDPACIYPLTVVPDVTLIDWERKGVPTPSGRVPMADATARDVSTAVARLRHPQGPAPARPATPTPSKAPCDLPTSAEEKLALALRLLGELVPLTNAQLSRLLDAVAPPASVDDAPAKPANPFQSYAIFGPISMINGRIVVGRELAKDEVAAAVLKTLEQLVTLASTMKAAPGRLSKGRKELAFERVEELRVVVSRWPAFEWLHKGT